MINEIVPENHTNRSKTTLSNLQNGTKAAQSDTANSHDKNYSVEELYSEICSSLEESKAQDIEIIDISKKSSIGDYMIVASGRSQRHVSAICDSLLRDIKKIGMKSAKVEGLQNGDWVLIDTGDIIVHVFRPEVREYYNLEKMWQLPESSVN